MSDVGGCEDPVDRVLWQRARQGDGESFGIIFDCHREAVRAFCARRTGSVDAADDLVSVVFLEAWRGRAGVELVHDSALPWLYGVAANTVRRRTRTAVRHRALLDRLPAEHTVPDHADDVAARLDDAARVAELHAALLRLRRADRDVLTLCLWQGLDHASAAVALGIPVGTVRSRLSRARARLAGSVGSIEGAPDALDGPGAPTAAVPPGPPHLSTPAALSRRSTPGRPVPSTCQEPS